MLNICVYGVGGVGGYFGGKIAHGLHRSKSDQYQIHFVARGEHLQEIKDKGLLLNTSEESLVCVPHSATSDITELSPPDLVLVCVKSYDLDHSLRQIALNIKDETIILPLLNGVDIYDRVRNIIKTGIVLPACVYVGTHIEKPGVVTQAGGDGLLLMGLDPHYEEFVPEQLLDLFDFTDVKYRWQSDPQPAIWEKFLFISAFGLITACHGRSIGEVIADAELKEQVRGVMAEVLELSKAKGINLPVDIIEKSLQKAGNFPFEARTSYQRDIESGRKCNEGDLFGGTILRLANEYGLELPITCDTFLGISK
ncbi:MAG: ketopantoate reductase family protein [Acidobacteriota bacterium]